MEGKNLRLKRNRCVETKAEELPSENARKLKRRREGGKTLQ